MNLQCIHKAFLLLMAASAIFIASPLSSFEIRHQTGTAKIGYGDCDMSRNGELGLMHHLLKRGDIVFDVGANRGGWSQSALSKEPSIQLFSFEPIPEVFEILKTTFASLDNVQTFPYAMSNEKGQAYFYHYTQDSEKSGFYDRPVLRGHYQPPQQISVDLETLDLFCATHAISKIDFLKIDTEGAEWKVLQGAKNLLGNHQIRAIQFEYGGCYTDAGTTLRQIMELLTQNRYAIFRIVPDGLIHISRWTPSLENFEYSNYFAICQEDMPQYRLVRLPLR